MLHQQLEAKILGKRLHLENMSKISHIREIHALIKVSGLRGKSWTITPW